MTWYEILIIALAVFGSAVIKNGVGVGAGIFLLPFLALVLPPKLALGLGAPAMVISDIVGVKNYWREWNSKELVILIPFAVLGVVLGTYLVDITPETLFKRGVAIYAILFSSMQIFNTVRVRYFVDKGVADPIKQLDKSIWGSVVFGFLGGVASTVAHAGGLMMSVYLLRKRANPRIFVGTFVLLFALVNLCKILAYASIGIINSQIFILVALLSPIIVLGGILGNILNKQFSQEMFRFTVLILIFVIGLRLLLSA